MNPRLIEVVIDGRMPDGSAATEDDVAAAIRLALDHDRNLCDLLCRAKLGRRINGDEVGWDEREGALEELEKMRAPRHERPVAPVGDDRGGADMIGMAEDLFAAAEAGHGDARRALTEHHLRRRALHDEPRVRVTVDARVFLEQVAPDLGYEPETLLQPVPRGRLRDVDRLRRDALARAVNRARGAGATLDAIGAVIGIPKQRVFDLAEHGRALDEGATELPAKHGSRLRGPRSKA